MFLTTKVVSSHAMNPYDINQFISNVGTWVEVSGQLQAMAALPSVYVLYVFKLKLLWALRRYRRFLGKR